MQAAANRPALADTTPNKKHRAELPSTKQPPTHPTPTHPTPTHPTPTPTHPTSTRTPSQKPPTTDPTSTRTPSPLQTPPGQPRCLSTLRTPTTVPRTPDINAAATIPRSVFEPMESVGAELRYLEGLVCVRCRAGDAAYQIFDRWTRGLRGDKDPGLHAVFHPQPATVSVPPIASFGQIMLEANAIMHAYRGLRAVDFAAANHPPIGGFVGPVGFPVRFSNAAMATHAVVERIADPGAGPIIGGAPYPTIMGLPPGTYVCTVLHPPLV